MVAADGEITFGPFRLDLGRRELLREGKPIPLSARARDLLCVLVSAQGDLVTKDQLMAQVWPGLVVEENNLHVHISALRKALSDGASGQSYLITVPGRGYRFIGAQTSPAADTRRTDTGEAPVPADKPSIAVLPFQNMSGDPQQEYFADGMVEEIITALARFKHLFVIARNSSFTYKGRAIDVKQVGRELTVRYVLEGSVRRAANRIRVMGKLIDASTGAHLWADRFEGALEDIFGLQDRVTGSVVGAITPRLEEAEIERTRRKPTKSLDAYDCYLRGAAIASYATREANEEGLRWFYKATELDPHFAAAYARAALCHAFRKGNGWMTGRVEEVAEAARLARRAIDVGRDDAAALAYGGFALAYVAGQLEDGAAFVDRALTLNSNLAGAWAASGLMKICFGEPHTALERMALAMRLSPLDPLMFVWQIFTALAHFCAGRYDEAASWAARALRGQPDYPAALRVSAASNALAGCLDEAERAMTRLRQLDPTLHLSNLEDVLLPRWRPEDRNRYVGALVKAGLPH